MMVKNNITRITLVFGLITIIFSIIFYFSEREKQSLMPPSFSESIRAERPDLSVPNTYWANEILKGGYILYFRHAEREKWSTVTAFDAIEVKSGINGRSESWRDAVCLTRKGIEEAKLLGLVFEEVNLKISRVISSKSCRAKETALYAFGKIDETWLSILHSTAIPDHQKNFMAIDLKKRLKSLEIVSGENIVVAGHGNTLNTYQSTLFDTIEISDDDFVLEELGFIVLELKNDQIFVRHAFKNFTDFAGQVLEFEASDF